MIRHRVSEAELLALIDAEAPTWRARAQAKAAEVAKRPPSKRKIGEKDAIWSDVKDVFMKLQGYKCMYCELPMPRPSVAGVSEGKVVYDVEHFRPKNRVLAWPPKDVIAKRHIDYAKHLNAGLAAGYVWLAFDPFNYGVSCKVCNSELKRDRFPILGVPSQEAARTKLDEAEVPCLLHPIGDEGPDPEAWLEWTGPIVRPSSTLKGDTALRARALVDFFELDTRPDLLEQRAMLITLLGKYVKDNSPKGRANLAQLCEPRRLFAGCARAFVALSKRDPKKADDWVRRCEEFVVTQNPGLLVDP